MDGQEPHIRTLLGFMGIDDVTFVRAEKLAFGPEAAEAAIAEARAPSSRRCWPPMELPLARAEAVSQAPASVPYDDTGDRR